MKPKIILNKTLKMAGYNPKSIGLGTEFSGLQFINSENKPKKVIVFLHGAGNDSSYPFFALIPKLIRDHVSFVFADLPGHGENVGVPIDNESICRYMKALSEWLKRFEHETTDITIVAHSIGSVSLLRNHTKFQNIDLRLVTISPPKKRNSERSILDIVKILIFESLSFLLPSIWLSFLKWREALIPAVGHFNRSTYPINPTKPSSFYKFCEKYINETDVIQRLSEFNSKHLLISAGLDYIAPPFSPEELRKIGRNHHQVTYDHENHFSILFNKKCHENIESFIFQD